MTAAGRVSRPERNEQRVLSREVRRKEKRERPRRGSRRARAGRHSEEAARAGVHHARAPSSATRVGARSSSARARRTEHAARSCVRRWRRLPALNVPRSCYVCKAALHAHARFLRPHVRRVRRLQLRQALANGGPARARRADQRRARQDRLPGRDHAAACRRARDRDARAFPATRRSATRARRTSRTFEIGSRSTASICVTAPSVEAFAAGDRSERAAPRLHASQCLPDRASAGRVSMGI